jgi:hypothetical protein
VWSGTAGSTTLRIGTTAGGSEVDSQLVSGANGSTGANPVDTGTYFVSETDPGASYVASLECLNHEGETPTTVTPGADGSVAVGDDDIVVCTFTNTEQLPDQGSIQLDKVWSGTPGTTTLRIGTTADGSEVDSQTVSGANGSTGANTVNTGTYFVSETDPGDYDTTLACENREVPGSPTTVTPGADGSVAVGEDDVVVCTFTNTRQQGSIQLDKVWSGTPGTTTLRIGTTADGSEVDSETVSGANGTTGASLVDTGTYFVSETDPGDYDTTLACENRETLVPTTVIPGADGSVAVGEGDVVVCTFTNTERPAVTGELRVTKTELFRGQRQSRAATGKWIFTLAGPNGYTGTKCTNGVWNGSSCGSIGSNSIAFTDLPLGTYTLCERAFANWRTSLGSDRCESYTLTTSQARLVTVNNTCTQTQAQFNKTSRARRR